MRTKIDGKRAIIQRCSDTDERKGFRYIYYVTFPKLKVYNGQYFSYGMFNFTVAYRNPRYSSVAERIVRSIDFEKGRAAQQRHAPDRRHAACHAPITSWGGG